MRVKIRMCDPLSDTSLISIKHEKVKEDIRNPLRSLSGVACTIPDTSKSNPTTICSFINHAINYQ